MGADSFHVCYGVRYEVSVHDESTIDALEHEQHPWQVAATSHGLSCWWAGTIDEETSFVLIGRTVHHYGWQHGSDGEISKANAVALMAETDDRLRAAGFNETPAWHFQFCPDR